MDRRRVHFADDYAPSSLSLRLKLGPKEHPAMVLKIIIEFEMGKLPRIRVRTKKPREERRQTPEPTARERVYDRRGMWF